MGVGRADLKLFGSADFDLLARDVGTRGDADGDGVDDLLVGVQGDDEGVDEAGAAYVVWGPLESAKSGAIEGAATAKLLGDEASEGAGRQVAFLGDVTGDGLGDLGVSAPLASAVDTMAGEVYVLTASEVGLGAALLSSVATSTIRGSYQYDYTGVALETGDVNGDGTNDV
jgi:hypothetical protein